MPNRRATGGYKKVVARQMAKHTAAGKAAAAKKKRSPLKGRPTGKKKMSLAASAMRKRMALAQANRKKTKKKGISGTLASRYAAYKRKKP